MGGYLTSAVFAVEFFFHLYCHGDVYSVKHFFEIRANQIDGVVVTLDAMSYTLGAAAGAGGALGAVASSGRALRLLRLLRLLRAARAARALNRKKPLSTYDPLVVC